MSWSVKNMQDVLLSVEENPPLKTLNSGGTLRYQCDCGSYVAAFRLVDCRNLLNVPQDFACDGCWTKWQREGVDIDGEGLIDIPLVVKPEKHVEYKRPIWSKRWMKAHGAPNKILNEY